MRNLLLALRELAILLFTVKCGAKIGRVVTCNSQTYKITHIYPTIVNRKPWVKGVARYPNGVWGTSEHYLRDHWIP